MRCCADHGTRGAGGEWPLCVWEQPSVCHKWALWRCMLASTCVGTGVLRIMLAEEKWDSGWGGGGRWPPVMSSSLEGRGSGKLLLCKPLLMDPLKRYYNWVIHKINPFIVHLYIYRDHFTPYPMNTRRRCLVLAVRTLSSGFTILRAQARSWRPPRGWLTPSSSATGPAMLPRSRLSLIK